ncbi:neural cell adhesion molecule 2 isoform X1 [Schistocerca piceifrons]|uniref:neural cell adhesion molecule 2 isoform X1 n=1 Tax=Schistocerca piceifrons TaxID=274613 RepID=UPI001F5E3921|nr:neural cell adhesion molecule 2 isoform X1 [Schistocerca piceifrons]
MVLWFKEADGEPLYSFDVRGREYGQAKTWSAPRAFGSRAFFRTATTPAQLLVDDLALSDEGVYRCRVDFRDSPTRNLKINLTVIIPPHGIVIYDDKRRDRSQVKEAYNEGAVVNLVCEVSGGRPMPRVTWFLENTVIDDSFEQRPADGLTVNHLTFPNIGRQHLHSRLICQASNTNMAPPVTKLVVLDINLKPISVNILTREKAVSADRRYEVECKSSGSRPEAIITWWKGSRQIKRHNKNFSEDSGASRSILTFIPVIDDDGKYLTCRAENPYIQDSALEDKWRLNVHYMPVVTLKMGSSLNPDDIKEGDDVYFECNIRANPKAYRLAWFHNGREMHHNVTAGIILSDQSLVLQGVTRLSAGDYTCLAANTEGKGTSNPVTLRVMYAPTCRDEREQLLGALKHETVALRCEVDASPAPLAFHWTFNNSGELAEVPPARYTSLGAISSLNYTPVSDMDYGTLACWATNAVGNQRAPCVFQVVAAGRPFPLVNCTVVNQTSDSLHVECLESFDGGLPQSFLMEVLELPQLQLRRNATAGRAPPAFDVFGLEAGASYQVRLYAVNAKGRSEAYVIDAVTFKGVAKFTGPSSAAPMNPVLTALVATAAALLAVVCAVIVALYRRHRHRRQPRHDKRGPPGASGGAVSTRSSLDALQEAHLATAPLTPGIGQPAGALAQEDTDPDLIPNKYERRPIKGFMKMYKTPPQRRRKKSVSGACDGGDDDDDDGDGCCTEAALVGTVSAGTGLGGAQHRGGGGGGGGTLHRLLACKDATALANCNSVSPGLRSAATSPSGGAATLPPLLSGPEVVTASHRIQESCI